MKATPTEVLKTLHPETPKWGHMARRLSSVTPAFNEHGEVDWEDLGQLLGVIWVIGACGGAVVAMMVEPVLGAQIKQAIFNTCLWACTFASSLILLGQVLCARWKDLSPDQIKQVANIVSQPGREAWSEAVVEWLRHGTLQLRHLRALSRAEQIERELDRVAEEKNKHQEAMSILMRGPVGAMAMAQSLEEHTPAASGTGRQGGRL